MAFKGGITNACGPKLGLSLYIPRANLMETLVCLSVNIKSQKNYEMRPQRQACRRNVSCFKVFKEGHSWGCIFGLSIEIPGLRGLHKLH